MDSKKRVAFGALLKFLEERAFDSFDVNTAALPYNTGEELVEHVRGARTEEFKTLVAAARRAFEDSEYQTHAVDVVNLIDEKKDPDSVTSCLAMLTEIANKVPQPFLTIGVTGGEVQEEPCYFIGSKAAVAKFRAGQAPEFK